VRLLGYGANSPVVGFIRQGVGIEPGREFGGTYRVSVGFPAVPRGGALRTGWREERLTMGIDLEIASDAIPGEQSAGPERPDEIVYGLYREMPANIDGEPFAFVRCGRTRILERRAGRMKVAADYEIGELVGWIDAAPPGERDSACDVGRELPRGYEQVWTKWEDFSDLSRARQEFFVRVDEKGATRCQAWKFDRRGAEPALISVEGADVERVERTWYLQELEASVDPRDPSSPEGVGLVIGGATWCNRAPRECFASGGVDGYLVVARDRERLSVIEMGRVEEGDTGVIGYRTSSAETWFVSRKACEGASDLPPPGRAADSLLRSRHR
jgi:hypothetical protein